ncbi:MAG: ABC transporter substrate-binding protein [Anaerolineaceae bacterium]
MPLRIRPACMAALLSFSLMLSACLPQAAPAEQFPLTPPAQDQTPAQPTALPPTPAPPRSLVICLGQEPATLYPFGSADANMWSVLEAVYDGPFDLLEAGPQPVILQAAPSFENGDAALVTLDVFAGDEVLDAAGELVALAAGVRVLPSGCTSLDCVVTWDGSSPLQMDRLVLRYRLLPGLTWSDGAPLTAADSVFSYGITQDPATPVSRRLIHRTASYMAIDETTVEWIGVPGFFPASFDSLFWLPQPKHRLNGIPPQQLLSAHETSRSPLGWGAYVVQEWVAGDHIRLTRNERYFRAAEGLPRFDTLVYRFLDRPADDNLLALLVNECDIIDQTSLLDEQLAEVLEMDRRGTLTAYISQTPAWEHLDFGIHPASYDDGYHPGLGDRPHLFYDARVRQAFAYCADRQGIVDEILFGRSSVPGGFFTPGHPGFLAELAPLPFDIVAGQRLLDEAGWRDLDGDPATPRLASGVANVSDGTALSVSYATTQAPLRVAVAQRLAASLAQCGIQVTVQYHTPAELFAPGPGGVLFGRSFDLAQYAWEASEGLPCFLFQSAQIPYAGNNWLGVNISGYRNPAYDTACQAALISHPAAAEAARQAQENVQRLFAQEMPSIPLFFRLRMAVSRPDLCGLQMDGYARSAMWRIEQFDFGEGCPG